MCGICGIYGQYENRERMVEKMSSAIIHRGPDDVGYFNDPGISVANRRLSIIDIKGGHQPIISKDGRWVIVYNGEIYNYRELRNELIKERIIFHTDSDTEVLLNQFIHRGLDGLSSLNGMFAFSIWDTKEKKLFLGRDPIGIKPLYYAIKDKNVFFASEIKSLRQVNDLPVSVDIDNLRLFLSFRFFPHPYTMFKGIYSLEPGTCMIIDSDGIKEARYFRFPDQNFYNARENNEWIENLEELLINTIKKQEIGEVPLGSFISGGLDSALICSIMQKNRKEKLLTCTLGFEERNLDESRKASFVAEYLSTNHHSEILTDEMLTENFKRLMTIYDMPSGDGFQQYFLYRFSRNLFTVSLSGTGADELFGGYDWFTSIAKPNPFLAYGQYFPDTIKRRIIQFLSKIMPGRAFMISKLWQNGRDFKSRFLSYKMLFSFQEANNLIPGNPQINPSEYFDKILGSVSYDDPFTLMVYLQVKLDLLNILLRDADILSMSNSLEIRVPYLDLDLVRYSFQMPSYLKQKGNTNKYALRKIAEKYLPSRVSRTAKTGFLFPLDKWLKKTLHTQLTEIMSDRNIEQRGFWNTKSVVNIKDRFMKGDNNPYLLWNLFIIESFLYYNGL
ncbi:MAG: asparagine synthase (glutamine-hydrolyzing) [Candidatus Coatesbacteria bacterium]|nr:asparagine synthase (glutamine-hydrolyzing) [Candidatus Coatesbacteria bacterium]